MIDASLITRFGKVAVMMGGESAERPVSLKSGAAVLNALCAQGVDAHAFDPAERELDGLSTGGFDRVFLILHGRGGEDGVMQGALDLMGLPYTGSGVLGSALGMDKLRCKLLWAGGGLPTPRYARYQPGMDLDDLVAQLALPLMIKPAHEGSSIGMSKVTERCQLEAALAEADRFDGDILIEQWVHGQEYTASILNGEVLPLIRLETPQDFYTYDAKYTLETTAYHCPCGLPAEQEKELQALCLEAFEQVGAGGWGRVDLMMDDQGKPWLLEVNTAPGMTDHSLVPMAAKQAGIDFGELCLRILAATLSRQGDH